jgi:hypothetical protein
MNGRRLSMVIWVLAFALAVGGAVGCAGPRRHLAGKPRIKFLAMPRAVPGKFTKDIILQEIERRMPEVRGCQQQAAVARPGISGVIRVKWTIMPNGRTTAINVLDSIPDAAGLEACITARIADWRFPSHSGGSAAKLSYPFVLSGE